MFVKDIMTHQPVCCRTETGLAEVARMMRDYNCGSIPVLDGNNRTAVGIVTDRDIVCRALSLGRNPLEMAAGQVMSSHVVAVSPEASLRECGELMEAEQVRRLLVIDRAGRFLGIVAQADMARSAPPQESAQMLRRISEAIPNGAVV